MKKINYFNIGASCFFVLVGCALGWWIIDELIDSGLAIRFLYGSFAIGTTLLYFQALLAVKGGERLVFQLLLSAGLCLATAWTALCIAMPLMFFHDLSIYAKLFSALIIIFFCTINVRTALRSARELWSGYGALAFTNHLSASNASVAWEKVASAMHAHRTVAPIGVPRRWHSICSKILYAFAIAGLYLAGLYSVFAVVSWAIPATIIAGVMLQHASHLFFQAHSVWLWEKDNAMIMKFARLPMRKKKK